jgi:hypothetical protein
MPVTTEELATALLQAELPTREVAGLMLQVSDVDTPVAMLTPPDEESVLKVLAKGWKKAATVLESKVPEFLGSRLAKHSSIQVRRLLAETTDDIETLKSLHDWALKKDRECLDIVIPKLDPRWTTERVITEGLGKYPEAYVVIVGHHLATKHPEAMSLIESAPEDVRRPLLLGAACCVAEGSVPGWGLTKLFSLTGNDGISNVVDRLTSEYKKSVSDEMAEALVKNPVARKSLKDSTLESATGFTPRAVELLMDVNQEFINRAIDTDSWSEVLDLIIALQSMSVVAHLVSKRERVQKLSKEQFAQLVDSIPKAVTSKKKRRSNPYDYQYNDTEFLSSKVITWLEHELETGTLLQYLRNTDGDAAWSWLCGKTRTLPRTGEFAQLSQNPGTAFGTTYDYSSSSYERIPATITDFTNELSGHISDLVDKPWADEIIDGLGSQAVAELVHRAGLRWPIHDNVLASRQYLANRITREIGIDADTWREALTHIARSNMPLGTTLAALRRLRGMSKPDPSTLPELPNPSKGRQEPDADDFENEDE